MIPFPSVNLIGVLAAAILGTIISGIWFSPPVFGNTWLRLHGIAPEAAKGKGLAAGIAFLSTLLTAYLLGLLIKMTGATSILDGLEVSFLAWLAFSFLIELPILNLERKSNKFAIHVGSRLVLFLAMGAVLALWA